jgi:hypothetical protein
MACPYFCPVEAKTEGTGLAEAMLPLGDLWEGVCCAVPDLPRAAEAAQWPLCNLGYARGQCPRFPASAETDAVRFALRTVDADELLILYSVERDHHPYQNGLLCYSISQGSLTGVTIAQTLQTQAEAYARSFLRRTQDQTNAS